MGIDNPFSREAYIFGDIMRIGLSVVIALASVLIIIAPVSATCLLTNTVLLPDGPLITGTQQHVTATYAILPTWENTFVRGHSLQFQTNLTGARWNIQVVVDGRNAAQQTASGSAAFVSGEILSYPTSHDVSLVVAIDGTVPRTESAQQMLLKVTEIDNSGNAVLGSVIVINQPMAVTAPTSTATTIPILTPTPAASPTTMKSPGFTSLAGVSALGAGLLFLSRRGERK
jgi:hypothetical protein